MRPRQKIDQGYKSICQTDYLGFIHILELQKLAIQTCEKITDLKYYEELSRYSCG